MENQGKRKLKRKNRWADMLAAIILCGALVLGVFTLRDYVRGKMLNFSPAREGSITLTLPAEMLVLRHEYVLLAPIPGPFVPEVEEGARVKEGALLGYCGGEPIYAVKGGTVSYVLDGWEQKLPIDALYTLDLQQVFALLAEEQAEQEEPALAAAALAAEEIAQPADRPVARLVDNLLDYTVMLRLKDPRGLLAGESSLNFTLTEGKTLSVSLAKADRWQTLEDNSYYDYYIFTVSSKEDILFNLRYSEAEVIAKEVRGIIVPSSAVTTDEQGRVGVFIQKKRKLVFTKVEELTSKDDLSVVTGIDKNAVVVTNPAKATDGQQI